jgi:hypothetical protein
MLNGNQVRLAILHARSPVPLRSAGLGNPDGERPMGQQWAVLYMHK